MCPMERAHYVSRAAVANMSADAEPGKRKRAAVARHDADYAYADDPDDYEEAEHDDCGVENVEGI